MRLIIHPLLFLQMYHAFSEALGVLSQLKAQAVAWSEDQAKSKRGKGIIVLALVSSKFSLKAFFSKE